MRKEIEAQELFTVVDLETTGLDAEGCQIIELAAIQTNLEREIGRLEMRFQLNGEDELPEFITNLTGITEEDLRDGYPEEFGAILFGLFSAGTTVVAQNAPFDLSFLAKFGIKPDTFLCTRAMAKMAEPTESASLKNVTERWGIEYKGHHRAINDCVMTIEVLKAAMQKLEEKGVKRVDYQNVVLDMPDRPLKFKPLGAKVGTVSAENEITFEEAK